MTQKYTLFINNPLSSVYVALPSNSTLLMRLPATLAILMVAVVTMILPFSRAVAETLPFPDPALTPYGAEIAGNPDSGLPPWQGASPEAKLFGDNILDEKPLFTITRDNLDEHKSRLPDGLRALIERYPDTMAIPVYKSYRYAYYPDWIYQAVAKNHRDARLIDDGNSLDNAWPGIPFPRPRTAREALWNHLLAYKGPYSEVQSMEATVHPNAPLSITEQTIRLYFNYYDPQRGPSAPDDMYLYYLSTITKPTQLAGGALLVHERINPTRVPRQAWVYLPEQRKVMRVPNIDYDSPMRGSEAIRFADEVDIYNGSIDRYDWTLEGKQELIVPYNNNQFRAAMYNLTESREELLTPFHINPDRLRYELHRVWVIKGVLKDGKHHPYRQRILYLDEDSWLAILAENYDKSNTLWRVSISYTSLLHKLPGIFKAADVFHDLKNRGYYIQAAAPHGDDTITVTTDMPPKGAFMPAALRNADGR